MQSRGPPIRSACWAALSCGQAGGAACVVVDVVVARAFHRPAFGIPFGSQAVAPYLSIYSDPVGLLFHLCPSFFFFFFPASSAQRSRPLFSGGGVVYPGRRRRRRAAIIMRRGEENIQRIDQNRKFEAGRSSQDTLPLMDFAFSFQIHTVIKGEE